MLVDTPPPLLLDDDDADCCMKISGTINSCTAIFFCARATLYSPNFTAIQTIQRDATGPTSSGGVTRAQRVSWVRAVI